MNGSDRTFDPFGLRRLTLAAGFQRALALADLGQRIGPCRRFRTWLARRVALARRLTLERRCALRGWICHLHWRLPRIARRRAHKSLDSGFEAFDRAAERIQRGSLGRAGRIGSRSVHIFARFDVVPELIPAVAFYSVDLPGDRARLTIYSYTNIRVTLPKADQIVRGIFASNEWPPRNTARKVHNSRNVVNNPLTGVNFLNDCGFRVTPAAIDALLHHLGPHFDRENAEAAIFQHPAFNRDSLTPLGMPTQSTLALKNCCLTGKFDVYAHVNIL